MRTLIAVGLLLTASAAAAQYRDDPAGAPAGAFRDGPEVLAPPPVPIPAGVVAAGNFRAVYDRVGRPRMLVFWNRSFSDEVSSTYRDNLHAEASASSAASGSSSTRSGWNGTDSKTSAQGSSHSSLDVSVGAQRVEDGRFNPLDENVDFAVEAAFSQTLAGNGAQLIDRSLAMRTARGARGAGSRPNMQAIETEAATSRADLLIEVLQTSASGTPTGAVFKVTVKDIKRARLLATFTTAGERPYRKPKLVAEAGGFVRASAEGTSPDGVGRELANRTMAALAGSLR